MALGSCMVHPSMCCVCCVVVLFTQLEGDADEKAKEEQLAKEFTGVVDFLKKTLGDKVEKVTVSNR